MAPDSQLSSVMDPTTSSLLSQLYPTQQTPQAAPGASPATKAKKDSGSWLTRLIPTGGSLAGGAAGATAGAALGSVVPILGTGIGGILGGILGAGLGGAAGKVGENAVEGQSIGNDVAREGVSGAAGQAVGGVLGKVGGALAGKVLKTGANIAEKGATSKAAAETAQNLASEFPDAALNAKARTQFGFGRSLDLADQLGVTPTAQNFVNTANTATGSSGFLNGTLDNLVRNAGNVDLNPYENIVNSALSRRPGLGELAAPKGTAPSTAATAKDFLMRLSRGGDEGATVSSAKSPGGYPTVKLDLGAASPDHALDLLRQVGKLGSSEKNPDLKAAYGDIYNNLKGTIYNRPEVAQSVGTFRAGPEDMQALLKATNGNEPLANHLADIVNNAQSAQDILTPQSDFINMGKAGQQVQDYLKNVIGTGADAKAAAAAHAMGPANQITDFAGSALLAKLGAGGAAMTGNPMMLGMALPAALGSQTAKDAGTKVLEKLTGAGVQKGAAKTIAPALMGASQFLAHAPNYVPGQAPSPVTTGVNPMDISGQQGAQQQGQGGISPNEQMLQLALIGMQDPYLAQTYAPIVQSLMTGPIQKATSANTALQGAQQAFGGAGGGQGLVGGLLSKLGGAVTGGPAQAYNDQRGQLIAQLTALGIPTSAVPQLTNTPEAAASQWQTLQALVNSQGASTGAGLLAGVH